MLALVEISDSWCVSATRRRLLLQVLEYTRCSRTRILDSGFGFRITSLETSIERSTRLLQNTYVCHQPTTATPRHFTCVSLCITEIQMIIQTRRTRRKVLLALFMCDPSKVINSPINLGKFGFGYAALVGRFFLQNLGLALPGYESGCDFLQGRRALSQRCLVCDQP